MIRLPLRRLQPHSAVEAEQTPLVPIALSCLSVSAPPHPQHNLCLDVFLVVGIFPFLPDFLITSSPLILRSEMPDSSCITMRKYENLQLLLYLVLQRRKKAHRVWSESVEFEHKSSVFSSRCPDTFGREIMRGWMEGWTSFRVPVVSGKVIHGDHWQIPCTVVATHLQSESVQQQWWAYEVFDHFLN